MRSTHMKQIGADTRFRPGQSGNPKGRPKKNRAMAEVLRGILDSDILLGMKTAEIYRQIGRKVSDDDDPSVGRLMLESAIAHFIRKGNPAIFSAILERIDGPANKPEAEPIATITDDQEALDIFEAIELVRERRARKEQ